MRTDHTPNETEADPRIDYEPDHAIDVALDVALELADDPHVVEYIRRAQQERVRVREFVLGYWPTDAHERGRAVTDGGSGK